MIDPDSPEGLARAIYPEARVREGFRRSRTPTSPFALADRAFARMRALNTLGRPRNANFVLDATGRAAAKLLGDAPPLADGDDLPEGLRRAVAASDSPVALVVLESLDRLRRDDPDAHRVAVLSFVGRRDFPAIAGALGRTEAEVAASHRRGRDRLIAALRESPRPPADRPGPHDLQGRLPPPWSPRYFLEILRIARSGHNRWFPP